MPDTLGRLDRIAIRSNGSDRALSWTFTPGGHRVAQVVMIALALAVEIVLFITHAWGSGLTALLLVVISGALSRSLPRGSLPAPMAQAAIRRLSGVGREVRPERWRVDGPAARAFAAEIAQWQRQDATQGEFIAAEPEEVVAEHHLDGEPWPAPPGTLAEPWPVLDQHKRD